MGAVERVQALLAAAGTDIRVVHLEENTRTAELAARALGTEVGAKRADPAKIARLLGAQTAEIAKAAVVKERTGFAIGGVPPLIKNEEGRQVPTLMDRHLLRFPTVYAAAGSPFAIFPAAPLALARLVGADIVDLTEE